MMHQTPAYTPDAAGFKTWDSLLDAWIADGRPEWELWYRQRKQRMADRNSVDGPELQPVIIDDSDDVDGSSGSDRHS